jgi:hypothetical protein
MINWLLTIGDVTAIHDMLNAIFFRHAAQYNELYNKFVLFFF